MIKKAIATMFTISLVFVVVIAMAIIPAIGKLAGGNSMLSALSTGGANSSDSSAKGLAAMAKQNKDMTAKMKQQINEEAGALVQTCIDAQDRGEQCDQIQVLKELCESNGFFVIESCNDPRVRDMLSS